MQKKNSRRISPPCFPVEDRMSIDLNCAVENWVLHGMSFRCESVLPSNLENDFKLDWHSQRESGYADHQSNRHLVAAEDVPE